MKKTVLLFFFVILFANSKAQTLIDTNKVWNEVSCIYGSATYCFTSIYRFSGDTIIQSKQYKKLYRTDDSLMQSNWWYTASLREDSSKKIYLVRSSSTSEQLLYDFALSKNDTFKTCFGPFIIYVDSIDSITLLNGEKRKRYLFEPYAWPNNEQWIEGIGSISGIMNGGYMYCSADVSYDLLCFTEDSILKYKNSQYSTCYYSATGINEVNKEIQINIFQNPTIDKMTIIGYHYLLRKEIKLEIQNILGEKVFQSKITHPESEIQIEVSAFTPGIYLITLNDGERIYRGKMVKN